MTNSQLFKQAHKLAKAIILKGDCYRTTFAACLKFIKAKLLSKLPDSMTIANKIISIVSSVEKPCENKRQGFDDSGTEVTLIIEGCDDNAIRLSYSERAKIYKLGLLPTTADGYAIPKRNNWQNLVEYTNYLKSLRDLLLVNGFKVDLSRKEINGYYTSI